MESINDEGINFRSLPPLVEGKVHGYLRLVIDEVVWSRRSPGNVTVLASWWGELDSAQFRPADIRSGDSRSEKDIAETYTIKTNRELFREYLKNCETVELVVISEKNHQVVGTAQVSELSGLLNGKPYFQYVPILNDNGNRTGDVHITMTLSTLQKNVKSPTKKADNKITLEDPSFILSPGRLNSATRDAFPYDNDVPVAIKNAKQNENVYRSILKERRLDTTNADFKSFTGVNDKLVAQVVARAQRLRGAILKEARDEDPLALSDGSSVIDCSHSDRSVNDEANLYEYFLGKKMSRREEKNALDALRTTSPTPSLIDLAAETIRSCRNEKYTSAYSEAKISSDSANKIANEALQPESTRTPSEASPMDYVDSLKVAVESLTLSPAGFRRVRSSCLSRGDGVPLSVTYFVQYDSTFGNARKFNRKIINESKPVKLCSKKQVGQVIYFNHEAVYDLPKTYLRMDVPLKFKIFNRHLNQRTPTELGIGSMYIADASRARSLSSTQRLAIVNKGIKIGELKVTAELGCDKIHFGKQFVEAVTSAKENIPVLEVSSVSSLETPRYRTTTGSESKENTKPPTSSSNKPDNVRNCNNVNRTGSQETNQRRDPRDGERDAGQEEPHSERDNSVLLHGLIYVAQGKDLSSFSTYLICRGFWREDRAISRVCSETNNPFYNFHQLVPLVHGQNLLERTRNNCIVVEVYSRRTNGSDELLGISKLSLHRLYVAYRDPQVLPHLLRSKYPVISVDEWVPISHPVTGRHCGQIHALVAVGTADQIALLEMTRGLRDSGVHCHGDPPTRLDELSRPTSEPSPRFAPNHETPSIHERTNRPEYENYYSNPDKAADRNLKSASCQTEITTVKHYKQSGIGEEDLTCKNPQSLALNVIVDRLAQALNVPKSSVDQAAQTNEDFPMGNACETAPKMHIIEPLNLNPSTNNSFSVDSGSDADSQRDHFFPSREVYRSVGVGAEFDDPANSGPSTSYANANSNAISNNFNAAQTSLPQRDNESSNPTFNREIPHVISSLELPNSSTKEARDSKRSDNENSSFRAVVEIECALYLPRVEKMDDTVEPCTYVTFQRARSPNETQYGCYIVTNVYPFSCSPKWDWRGDTRLSNDLLINEEKRLILKVWRLVNPEASMQINLERDIVIGFAAIDVSVLTVGFPVVSGWFHVMDFTGKCNGQIKVSITPLDNIAAFGKSTCQSTTSRAAIPDADYSNSSSPYHPAVHNSDELLHSGRSNGNLPVNGTNRGQTDQEPVLDIGLNLGDASMSFLSLSLKQKLTELDEIKKRLQTRLQDVTSTAFDDDSDTDFDPPIVDENDASNGNAQDNARIVHRRAENWHPSGDRIVVSNVAERGTMTNGNRSRDMDDLEAARMACNSNSGSLDANYTDTGYSTGSNVPSNRHFTNGNHYPESEDNRYRSLHSSSEEILTNEYDRLAMYAESVSTTNGHCTDQSATGQNRTNLPSVRNYRSVDSEVLNYQGSTEAFSRNAATDNRACDPGDEHPIRGTRMHISHLLDKLTTQLTAVPPSTANQPANKRNIMDLITSLRRSNNNFTNETKCNREVNVRTVPTQTEMNYSRETPLTQMSKNSTETRDSLVSNGKHRGTEDTRSTGQTERESRKMSSVVREELAADDGNETLDSDELSTHLMTTNVRHMDLQSMLNPLLYQHVIPDVRACANSESTSHTRNNVTNKPDSPEVEAIERLDTRYAENFNTAINNGLSRLRNLVDNEAGSRCTVPTAGTSENDEIFRMTPSGISENIDGNIDVTVIHKPCNDDLMASNSVDSTTTISLIGNDLQNATDNDDSSSLNSTGTSVSGVSRQAPDGGNPVEESAGSSIAKPQNDSCDSSSTS